MDKNEKILDHSFFDRMFDNPTINKAKNSIRFVKGLNCNGRTTTFSFGYFKLDENGVITGCERGFAKYKGFKVTELDKFPPTIMFGREL